MGQLQHYIEHIRGDRCDCHNIKSCSLWKWSFFFLFIFLLDLAGFRWEVKPLSLDLVLHQETSSMVFNGNRLLHIKANLKRKLVTFLSICLMVSENCFLISRESKEFSPLPWVHDDPCKLTFYLFSWFLGSQLAESEEEKLFDEVQVSLRIKCEGISPFCFPSYKSPDTKDDMVRFSKNFSSCHS